MKVKILHEAGYEQAMLGLSLSYNRKVEEMPQVAAKLCRRGDEEAKFLRQMCIWIDVTAPRYWWQQMREYKYGMEWQSASTMHTLLHRELTNDDFVEITGDILWIVNTYLAHDELELAKAFLPEGFLQRRICCTNYQTIRRIIRQRRDHRLPEWCEFIGRLVHQLEHQEFIGDLLFRKNGSRIGMRT